VAMSSPESEAVALLSLTESLLTDDEPHSDEAGDGNGRAVSDGEDLGGGAASPQWSPKPGERVFVFAKMFERFRRCPGSIVECHEVDDPRFTRDAEACIFRRCDCNHVEWGPHGPTYDADALVFVRTDVGLIVAVNIEDLRRMQSYAVGQERGLASHQEIR
jgi:hypothetical protein